MAGTIDVVCAWCDKEAGIQRFYHPDEKPVSHGMCERHRKETIAEIQKLKFMAMQNKRSAMKATDQR